MNLYSTYSTSTLPSLLPGNTVSMTIQRLWLPNVSGLSYKILTFLRNVFDPILSSLAFFDARFFDTPHYSFSPIDFPPICRQSSAWFLPIFRLISRRFSTNSWNSLENLRRIQLPEGLARLQTWVLLLSHPDLHTLLYAGHRLLGLLLARSARHTGACVARCYHAAYDGHSNIRWVGGLRRFLLSIFRSS